MTGRDAEREQLAAALDGHAATIMGATGRTTWLDCSCGWETVVTSATGRLAGARERWRTHRADALLPVVDRIANERAAAELHKAADDWRNRDRNTDLWLRARPALRNQLAGGVPVTGQHRDILAPWMYRLRCWAFGHDIEQTGHRVWRCTRCDRRAATPVELP